MTNTCKGRCQPGDCPYCDGTPEQRDKLEQQQHDDYYGWYGEMLQSVFNKKD